MLKAKFENIVSLIIISVVCIVITLTIGFILPHLASMNFFTIFLSAIVFAGGVNQIIFSSVNQKQIAILTAFCAALVLALLCFDNAIISLIKGTAVNLIPAKVSLIKAGVVAICSIVSTKLFFYVETEAKVIVSDYEPKVEKVVEVEKIDESFPKNKFLIAKTQRNLSDDGKIAVIDKMLLNKRDLENIIETNALLQHLESTNEKITLISNQKGINFNKIFNNIVSVYQSINEIGIIDNAGRIIINNVSTTDKFQKGEILNFIYKTIVAYLEELKLITPAFIELQTDKMNIYLIQIKKQLIYINSKIVSEDESPSVDKIFDISNVVFVNANVFLQNLNSQKLKKVTIFTEDEKITIINDIDDFTCYKAKVLQQTKEIKMINLIKEQLIQEIA